MLNEVFLIVMFKMSLKIRFSISDSFRKSMSQNVAFKIEKDDFNKHSKIVAVLKFERCGISKKSM